MDIAAEKNFTSIKLLRVMDVLGLTRDKALTEEFYYTLTALSREMLLSEYGQSEENVRKMMKEDKDTLMTYLGFIKFLETDLKYSPVASASKSISGQQYRKLVKKVAIGMMIRAESFTKLLQAKCPDYVRLSIHPSSGSVKLSVPLITQRNGDFPRTPWHSVCALSLSGGYSMTHAKDVRETHRLIRHKRLPYYFRERSDLWDWENDDVMFEPRYPNALHIYPLHTDSRALTADEADKLKALAGVYEGSLSVTGFTNAADVDAALTHPPTLPLAASQEMAAPLPTTTPAAGLAAGRAEVPAATVTSVA
ncbi:MAG: hypothetical protein Q9162_002502 [Coniocarpon cinnabarinum]